MPLIAVLQERLAPDRRHRTSGDPGQRPAGKTRPTSAAGQLFRYRPGVREILRQGATRFDEWAAYAAVSRYLEDRQRLGGSLRVLIPDPAGTTKLDTGDEPIGALYETLVTRLGLRAGFAASTKPEQPAVEPDSEPVRPSAEELPVAVPIEPAVPIERAVSIEGPEPPSPEPESVDPGNGPSDEIVRDALDREIRALRDLADFTVVEFGRSSLDVWRISRDGNGTPQAVIVSRPPSLSHDDPAGFYAERLVPLLPEARMFIARGSPGEPVSAVFDLLAGAGARAYYCATPTRDLLREAIVNSPLTRPYELVVVGHEAGGRPAGGTPQLKTHRLFPPGAVRGDRKQLRVGCGSDDGHGTVFAVVTRSDREIGRSPAAVQFTPVAVQSAVLEPGDYQLTAVLARPGQVRFEGLPVDLRTDPRPWSEIVASVPDQPASRQPVHLIVAIEVSGGRDRLTGRIQRVEQLIASAESPVRRLAVSVIAYGPHSVERAVREEPVTVLAWATTSQRALRALRNLSARKTPAREYTRAAQLECALDAVVARIDPREGRLALVTVGGRPPHPPQVDLRSEIIPCANRVDWRRKIDQLRGIQGITFGALCDPDPRGEIWRQLGQDAFATVDIMDADRFAARLGLREPVQSQPFPLVRQEDLPARQQEDLPAQRQASPDRATAHADIALWGAPGSGKTTFLSALSIALDDGKYGYTVVADNDASETLLIEANLALVQDHEFPSATQSINYLQWSLHGRRQRAVPNGRGFEMANEAHTITLKLVDPAGQLTLPGGLAVAERRQLIGALANAGGIIFMIDPIREFEKGDAYATTSGLIAQLTRQVVSTTTDFDRKLPHYVAICITKFDEPRVLATAASLKVLRYEEEDPFRFPRVADSDAQQLLASLFSVSHGGYGDRMLNSLTQYFHADRVRFFVTSAVGFYVSQETGRFDKDNPQNVVKAAPGPDKFPQAQIRGPIYPINVVEPILWLAEHISAPPA